MAQKIKLFRRVSNVFTNRKFIFTFLFFITAFSLLLRPLSAAALDTSISGAVLGGLLSGVKAIASTLIILTSVFAAFISSFTATLATLLVGWILSPDFINLSYTNPGGPHANPIIKLGLGMTQGLVNLGLILALVYIALTTMLGLAGRETKKLLFYFVLVALLVNFAPVLCGIVVDASNIAMNAFIPKIATGKTWVEFGTTLLSKTKAVYDALVGDLSTKNFSDWETTANTLTLIAAQLAALTFVNVFITIVYLLYALIFMARYVFIWVLVILSPLAFVCYITPATKKYWTQWLSAFLQWCIIGIPAIFFLNLGEQAALSMKNLYGGAVPNDLILGGATASLGFIETLFFSGVPILLLVIGFILSMQMSAAGSGAIMNFSKKMVKRGGQGLLKRTDRGLQRATAGLSRITGIGKGQGFTTKQAASRLSRFWDRVPLLKYAQPDSVREYGQYKPLIEAESARAKRFDTPSNLRRMFRGNDVEEAATADILETVTRGDSNDIFGIGKEVFGKKLSDEQLLQNPGFVKIIGRALQIAKNGGIHNQILRRAPELAMVAAQVGLPGYGDIKDSNGRTLKGEDLHRAAVHKAVGEAREHIKDWEPETLSRPYIAESVMGIFDRDRFLQIIRQVKNGQSILQNAMDKSFTAFVENEKLMGKSYEEQTKAFEEHIKKLNNGEARFFTAIKDERLSKTGLRKPQIVQLSPTPGVVLTGKTGKKSQFKARGSPPDTGDDTDKKGPSDTGGDADDEKYTDVGEKNNKKK